MKKSLLILLIFLIQYILFAQNTEIDSLIKQVTQVKDTEKIEILNTLAGIYSKISPNDRIEFAEQSVKLSEKYDNQKSKAIAFGHLGVAYNQKGNTKESMEYFHKSLEIMEQINDLEGIANANKNLGQANFYMENYDKALEYFQKALNIRNKIGNKMNISQTLILIGNVKARTKKYDEALEYYFKTLKIKEEINDEVGISQIYNNIGNVYLAIGETDKVLGYRTKSLKIDRKLNNKWGISLTTFNIAEFYLQDNNPQKAYSYILESKKLAEELNNIGLINDNNFLLSWYYELIGDYKKSLEYQKEYAKIIKKQFSSELSEKVSEMEVKYETAKKEKEKQAYKLKLEKSNSHKLQLLFIIIIIVFIATFIFYQYYKNKKSKVLLEKLVSKRTQELQKKNTELSETGKALQTAKEKAEESNRLKTAFLHNMSHEIRTPMNGILGFTELLKKPQLTGEEQNSYIKIIEKSGARMLNIINDIITISRIESGEMNVLISDTNINEQIKDVYNFFKPEVEKKEIQFLYKNALSDKNAIIKTDQEKVITILTNLVKNAIKYTDKGSIEFGYNLKTDSEPNEVVFYVKDTGIGIPITKQKIIFERFIQADIEDKMARQGAGLGLSISKAYVEILGGRIGLESKAGIGSTFYFTLPYNTSNDENKTKKHIELTRKEEIQLNHKTLNFKTLIVEDDENSEMYLREIIKSLCKEIFIAKTGIEAIEICRKNPDIDLVLMDIQLPDTNGYEATRQIREFNKNVVIIAQTAFAMNKDREKAIKAGCNDYISKPTKKDELSALIRKYFDK